MEKAVIECKVPNKFFKTLKLAHKTKNLTYIEFTDIIMFNTNYSATPEDSFSMSVNAPLYRDSDYEAKGGFTYE